MQVLMTGGSGFVGRALSARLLEAGHRVRWLSRRPDPGAPVPVVTGDPALPGDWQAALGEADAVVHLAGEGLARRWTGERRARIRSSRVDSARLLAAGLGPGQALVSASAVGLYGDRGDEVLDEESAPGQGFLAEVCRDWEAAAREAGPRGARVAIARLGVVLGRDARGPGGALGRMLGPFRLGLGGRLGPGTQWLSWIHLADAAAALQRLLEDPGLEGPCLLCAPEPVTNREFTRALGRALNRPAVMAVPAFALRAALGDMAAVLLESQRAVPRRLQALGFSFQHPTLAGALADVLA